MKMNLGVMFGGASTEHEISIITAVQAMENIDKEKYNIIPIYLSKENDMYTSDKLINISSYKDLKKIDTISKNVNLVKKKNEYYLISNSFPYNKLSKIDIVLPIMHGYNTEDGTIAGFLEVIGIPYCESDLYASCIGQDKIYQKAVLSANNIPVTPYYYFYESEYLNNQKDIIKNIEKLKYPVIVKPARQGSSVGIKVASNKEELINAINEAINYDEKILVEKVVKNLIELNCSVLGDNYKYETSLIEEVYSSDKFLTYKDKYMSDGGKTPSKGMASTGRKVPADISKEKQEEIEKMSINACRSLNTSGVVRIDYLMDNKTGNVYLNEMNIIPGSLSFYLWNVKDVPYKELLNKIIECGIRKYKNKSKKFTSFDTNVLQSFKGTKGLKK